MTTKEAAIVSAYTEVLLGDFSELHKYIEEIMERPVFTHELASKSVTEEIKKRSKADFVNLSIV